jgi:hypothetical protein
MGIRFYCPNGHKLHVKEFQAGRQGICPHCGISMEIPLASTRASSKKRRGAEAGEDVEDTLVVPVGRKEDRGTTPGGAATPNAGAARREAGSAVAEAPAPQMPAISHPRPASSIPRPGTPAATPQRPIDPLDEIPTAVWYVRPPSGGQYGPATRDVMRGWMAEGRVSADSLVWREGWRDWSPAADVFPKFSAGLESSEQLGFLDDEIPVSATSPRKPAAATQTRPSAAAGNSRRLGLWIAGIVAALVLIGALIAAVMYRSFS